MRALGLRELIDEPARPSALATLLFASQFLFLAPQRRQFADVGCGWRAVGRCERSFCVAVT